MGLDDVFGDTYPEPDQTKNFLYQWLCKGKSTQVIPQYKYIQATRGGFHFCCKLSVEGYSYVGVSKALTKKESQTNAAKDFLRHLISTSTMNKNDIPAEIWKQIYNRHGHKSLLPKDDSSDSDEHEVRSLPKPRKYLKPKPDGNDLSYDADLDSNAEQYGNWTVSTAKCRLNDFTQRRGDGLQFSYAMIEPGWYRAELTFFINGLINAEEFGPNKHIASKRCALIMIRRLFELGYVEKFGEKRRTAVAAIAKTTASESDLLSRSKSKPGSAAATVPPSAKQSASQHTVPTPAKPSKPFAYPVKLDPSLMSEVYEVLKQRRIQPSSSRLILNTETTETYAASSLHQNEIQGQAGIVKWAPPKPNWNPWTSSEFNKDYSNSSPASLKELSDELLTNFKAFTRSQELNSRTNEMQMYRQSLPIFQIKSLIINAILKNSVVLIKGDTGCGKTTQICQYILDYYMICGKGAFCNVLVTQPRRISAIGVAERVATERAEELGESVGLSIKHESTLPRPYGSILFCTTGILLRKMETGLVGISHVIVDEVHERDINTDFLLLILRDMVANYPDLRVILMSATMDTTIFHRYFENSPVIQVSGRTFPVQTFFLEDTIETIQYRPSPDCLRRLEKNRRVKSGRNVVYSFNGEVPQNLNNVPIDHKYSRGTHEVMKLLDETVEVNLDLLVNLLYHIQTLPHKGAILIFLPGWKDIFQTLRFLQKHHEFGSSSYNLIPLHSQVPKKDQCRVFERVPESVTKIIISTNIAETSITIDDVVYVIDSCQTKAKIFTSHNNTSTYVTIWGSKSNLAQRCGRAGRVRAGYCFHLCSRARYNRLDPNVVPEILRTPLYGVALSIKLLGLGGITQVLSKAPERPPFYAVLEAEKLLYDINCLYPNGELTPLGRVLAKLPLHPRIGKMLLLGTVFTCVDSLAVISAYFSNARDIFKFEMDLDLVKEPLTKEQREFAGTTHSDHFAQLNAFQDWFANEDTEYEFCQENSLSLQSLRSTCQEKNHLLNILDECHFPYESFNSRLLSFRSENPALDIIAGLLCVGFYPNVCHHIEKRRVMTNDYSATIHKTSVTHNPQGPRINFPYPFFTFQEKIRSGIITCKGLTMVSPIHLILFGSEKVEVMKPGEDGIVRLDNWIYFEMNPDDAAAIVAIRSAIEEMLIRVTTDPENFFPPSKLDQKLIFLIEQLCHLNSAKGKVFEPYIEEFESDYGHGDEYDEDGEYENEVNDGQYWYAR